MGEAKRKKAATLAKNEKLKRMAVNIPFAVLIFFCGVLILMAYFAYQAYHEGPKKFFEGIFSGKG